MFDIILLNYKALDKLKRCIESVRQHTPEDYRITVVDNENSDASHRYLFSLQDAQVIVPERNLGSSGGTNAALRKTEREFIVLLDDDIEVTSGWLTQLYRQMRKRPEVGIVGCKIRFPNSLIMSAEYIVKHLKAVGYGEEDRGQRNYIRECDVVMRTCLLMRRSLLQSVGFFDERFFPGQYETMDYCLRARQVGWKILYVGRVCIAHHHLFRGEGTFFKMEKLFLEKWADVLKEFPLKDSHPADKHITAGLSYLEEKAYAKAVDALKRAEGLNRQFAQPLQLGVGFYHLGKYKAAIQAFQKAAQFAPGDIVPHHYLALLYEKIGRMRDMRREADTVLDYLAAHKGKATKKHLAGGKEPEKCIEVDASRDQITYYT